MEEQKTGCLVCGAPLEYLQSQIEMECTYCHKKFMSNARCVNGHFICDSCHEQMGLRVIEDICRHTDSRDPVAIMKKIILSPYIYMHGPEHHVMVGAALLTAYHNAGGKVELWKALPEMYHRGKEVPGGACGFWGACGAGISTGMYLSIVTKSTPLAEKEWGLSNQMTARALQKIGEAGGPRCCKRDSYLSIIEAVRFTEEKLGVHMEIKEFSCTRSDRNNQCIQKACPFYKAGR
mgnify:CR=1 FL=1